MLTKTSLILAVISSLATAKLDYGACPSDVTQTPYDASLSGTYYLQYYDSFLDYAWPVVKAMLKFNEPNCLSTPF